LLEAGAIDGARGILINITGSSSLKLAEVQQACTIIQSAAHEDANIIFGAVMDEKMKDAVKITVIATGFRESAGRHRTHEVRTSFSSQHAAALEDPMDFPDGMGSRDPLPDPPKHIMSEPEPIHESGIGYADDVVATPVSHASEQVADVISLDTMRGAIVQNFEQDDLDVPAFLRKRNEVM